MELREYLQQKLIITDGAMGTYYARLKKDESAISEMANLTEPEVIHQIHREYIEAGASLIRTNTFAANSESLGVTKEKIIEIVIKGCEIAKEEASRAMHKVYVAGSIGPIPEHADTTEEGIFTEYKKICDCMLEQQVDAILFETFHELTYIQRVVEYIRSKSNVFIMTNFCVNKNGYTRAGISANRLAAEISDTVGIDSFGFNCGMGSGHMLQLGMKLSLPKNKYIAMVPNAGYPEQLQHRMVFRDNAEYFKDNMLRMKELGAHIIGGCCGTTPAYIAAIVTAITDWRVPAITEEDTVLVDMSVQVKARPNRFYELFSKKEKVVAVELDPPYDANYERLIELAQFLKDQGTDIITVADSPMGRSRVDSILMSIKIAKEAQIEVMPHICCRDKNMIGMRSGILGAYVNDIRNTLIVTGDPVPSERRNSISSVFDYNSIRLMNFVKEMNVEHFKEEPIYYGGALNYARGNIDKVIERIEKKIEAGAKYFLTQPVYSDEDIERLRYIKQKVDTKLLCGIMPFVSYRNANFVKNEFTGIFVPEEIVSRYTPEMSKEEAEEVGAAIANEIIDKVKDFADGYYFMLPFNRVSLMDKIRIK